MNRIEQRLLDAAAELRQVTRHAVPPPIETRPRRVSRGWLVFAATFAAVLAVGMIPLLTGPGEGPPLAGPSTTVLETPTTTLPPTTSLPPPEVECSASGVAAPSPQDGLPQPVARTRQAIVEAAAACDFDRLEELAGPNFTTHFGGGGAEMLRQWEEEGRGRLGTLLKVLDTTYAVPQDNPDIYVWPAAFAYDTWEEIPAYAIEEVRSIHTDEELRQFAEFGAYAGWRVGIDENGVWLFFVAGD